MLLISPARASQEEFLVQQRKREMVLMMDTFYSIEGPLVGMDMFTEIWNKIPLGWIGATFFFQDLQNVYIS